MDSLDPKNIEKQLQDLKRRVRALELKKVKINSLEELTTDMGLQKKGEFRVGNDVEPGDGFTGGRFGYPGFVYDGVLYFFAGVNTDVLMVGFDLATGKLVAGAGAAIADDNGFGIHIPVGISAWQERLSYKFYDENGVVVADLYDYSGAVVLENIQSGTNQDVSLRSRTDSSHAASAVISAQKADMSKTPAYVGVELGADSIGHIEISAGGDGGGDVIIGTQNKDNDFIVWGNASNAVLTVDAGNNDVTIANRLKLGDTGMNIGGYEPMLDDTAISFTPGATKGVIKLYSLGAAATVFGEIIFNTATPTTSAMYVGSNTNITTGALSGTTGTDGKFTVSCHTDGKIYFENRRGATVYVHWNLFGGV